MAGWQRTVLAVRAAQSLPIPLWQLIYLIHLGNSCSRVECGVSAIRDNIMLDSRAFLMFSENTMTLTLSSVRGASSLVTWLGGDVPLGPVGVDPLADGKLRVHLLRRDSGGFGIHIVSPPLGGQSFA